MHAHTEMPTAEQVLAKMTAEMGADPRGDGAAVDYVGRLRRMVRLADARLP
jgi:hypothetical protein